MQASGLYASSVLHPLYQSLYHPIPPGPQDYELKKQYLALLPPQQIIDICLNFDLHVPPYVKGSVWPADISAAIAAMRKTAPPTTDLPLVQTSTATEPPAMGSLRDPSESLPIAANSIVRPEEVQPPDKSSPTPDSTASTQTSASAQPSPAPLEQATPTPAQVPLTTTTQQPPYPHQPYGYGHHPQAAYPHTPYYQPPPGYPPYPSPYPYPHQMPSAYPAHPAYPQQQGLPFTTAPLAPPQQQPQDAFNTNPVTTDDLPSYEEMIVEALQDSNDSEGCAPKDLFTWMAARYPLQSNFRPSASQALQKAFRRGRFQKSNGGKYRLNDAWEGGNTSRRTTRRPQTQNPTTTQQAAPASPFTHTPLVHHHQSATSATAPSSYQTQTYGFPFQQSSQGYSGYPQATPTATQQPAQESQSQPTAAITATSSVPADGSTHPPATDGAAHDAWEAAQNILKAINFDSLLQLPPEDEKSGEQDANSTNPIAGPSTLAPAAGVDPHADIMAGQTNANAAAGTVDYSAGRAELQAQLALLAAQLAELSQGDDDNLVVNYPVVSAAPPPPPPPPPPTSATPQIVHPPAVATNVPPIMGSFPFQVGPSTPVGGSSGVTQSSVALQTSVPVPVPAPIQAPVPVLHPPSIIATPEEEEDSENDDDMEEVI